MIIQNILQGLIWFFLPVTMIICCDIMSYMFGFFFGRTPLIKISPKKTWEGFIGGAFSTIIFALLVKLIVFYIRVFNIFFSFQMLLLIDHILYVQLNRIMKKEVIVQYLQHLLKLIIQFHDRFNLYIRLFEKIQLLI